MKFMLAFNRDKIKKSLLRSLGGFGVFNAIKVQFIVFGFVRSTRRLHHSQPFHLDYMWTISVSGEKLCSRLVLIELFGRHFDRRVNNKLFHFRLLTVRNSLRSELDFRHTRSKQSRRAVEFSVYFIT